MERALTTALLTAVTTAAALSPGAPVAGAVPMGGGVTIAPGRCGTVTITNTTHVAVDVYMDDHSVMRGIPADTVQEAIVQQTGRYTFGASPADKPSGDVGAGSFLLTPCRSLPARPLDGDQNGDGRADVLGIAAATGDLYYYPMTAHGLASGTRAGTGWTSMAYLQQVNEFPYSGKGNALLAVRGDGTVWRYDNKGQGRVAGGTQVGAGAGGASSWAVTGVNNTIFLGLHVLLMVRDGALQAAVLDNRGMLQPWFHVSDGWQQGTRIVAVRDMDGDHVADLLSLRPDGSMWLYRGNLHASSPVTSYLTPTRVGTGWGAMQTVASPGSLDGDELSDLVARRSDGNLYTYRNRGGRWSEGVRIGQKWNGIRLLA